jgi:hypothetical protein
MTTEKISYVNPEEAGQLELELIEILCTVLEERDALRKCLADIQKIVTEQEEEFVLDFHTDSIKEAFLQQELLHLHKAIKVKLSEDKP